MPFTRLTLALLLAAAAPAAPALACTADPLGDFEGTYTGPALGGIDISCISVRFDGTDFHLKATLADDIANAGASYLVWGVDRGAGKPRLQFIGAPPPIKPNLLFDTVFLNFQDGTAELGVIPAQGMPVFTNPVGLVSFSGNVLEAVLPLALIPSTGFAPEDYRFTLWSHYQAEPGPVDPSNIFKADFSPTIQPSVPEPAAWAMMILGFGTVGIAARRRRTALSA